MIELERDRLARGKALYSLHNSAEWKEGEHPRAKDGKFGSGGDSKNKSDDARSPEQIKELYEMEDDSAIREKVSVKSIDSVGIKKDGPIPEGVILHGSDSSSGDMEIENKNDRAFSASTDWNVLNRYGTSDIFASKINNPSRILDLKDKEARDKLADIIAEYGDSGNDREEISDSLENHNLESDYQIGEAYGRDNRLLTALRYSGYGGIADSDGNYDIFDVSVLSPYEGK
jgi:hypothetical protein